MPDHTSSVCMAGISHHELVSLDTSSYKAGLYRNVVFRIGPEQIYRAQ